MTIKLSLAQAILFWTAAIGYLGSERALSAGVADDQNVQLQEIIVTAERRAESLQEVPLSVAAYGQAEITRFAISSIEDITRMTPGLTLQPSLSFAPVITIRGVGDRTGASPTGVYIDDTPIQIRQFGASSNSGTAFPSVFDLERVEVLRGPQGTLFGAGSEGGAVRFITPEPSFSEYTGHARAEYGFNQYGSPSYQFGSAVGGPLSGETLAFRLSAYTQEDGGWIDRHAFPTTVVADKGVNSMRTTTVNAALAWSFMDSLVVTPKIFFQNLSSGGDPTYWRVLSNPSNGDFIDGNPINHPTQDQFSLPSLKIEWRLGNVSLISNTSNMNRTSNYTRDDTYLLTEVLGGDIHTSPNAFSPYYTQNPQHQFTQEIRVQSTSPNETVRWVLGAFYQRLDERAANQLFSPQLGDLVGSIFPGLGVSDIFGVPLLPNGLLYVGNDVTHDTQKAAFGQVDIRLFNQLTATLGVRYSKLNFSYISEGDGPLNNGPSGSAGNSSATSTSPKYGLEYKLRDGLMFYTSAAKGFRPGAANAPFPAAFCAQDLKNLGISSPPATYNPDSVWSYEVGSKGEVLDRRLIWDASVYRINWTNKQTNEALPICSFSFISNAGTARSDGFDLHTQYAASEHLRFEGSIGYDRAKFTKTVAFPTAATNFVTDGDPLPISPWHGFLSAEYEFSPLANKSRIYFHMDDSYASSHPTTGATVSDGTYDTLALNTLPSVNLLFGRIGIRNESWDVSLFAKNLLNAHPIIYSSQSSPVVPIILDETMPPRVIGITGTYRF